MPKQLSLYAKDEWWMKVVKAMPDEKKAEAVTAIKELLAAAFNKRISREKDGGKRNNQKSSFG